MSSAVLTLPMTLSSKVVSFPMSTLTFTATLALLTSNKFPLTALTFLCTTTLATVLDSI